MFVHPFESYEHLSEKRGNFQENWYSELHIDVSDFETNDLILMVRPAFESY